MSDVIRLHPEQAVVGIDTATNRMHWTSTYPLGQDAERYGWVSCASKNPDERRLMLLAYSMAMARYLEPGTHVFCEEPLSLQNGETSRLLALAAGAVWSGFNVAQLDIFWHWVDQSTWKKNVLGRGVRPQDFGLDLPKAKREKAWIESVVTGLDQFQLESHSVASEDFRNEPDLYDAWSIRTYGVTELAKGST